MIKKVIYGLVKKLKFLPADVYMKFYYEYYSDKKLDLKNPIEFNQKLSWLKVYYHPPILTQLVDKYTVRDYVIEKIGEEYLNDLIAVYYKASDVNFDELPNQFVIKGAHGYHFNIIVDDKNKMNRKRSRYLMYKWMRKNQYYRGGLEWAYKNVKPKLIAEKYLSEIDDRSIDDYKFFCFNGVPKFVQVDVDRGPNHRRAFYDLDWNRLEFHDDLRVAEEDFEQPENFEDMVTVATKLADKFPFVRVDLYSIKGKTLFGEMTFYPADARFEFYPSKYNDIIGSYIKLPKLKAGQKEITTV